MPLLLRDLELVHKAMGSHWRGESLDERGVWRRWIWQRCTEAREEEMDEGQGDRDGGGSGSPGLRWWKPELGSWQCATWTWRITARNNRLKYLHVLYASTLKWHYSVQCTDRHKKDEGDDNAHFFGSNYGFQILPITYFIVNMSTKF